MINSIQNGDQPLPVIAQVLLAVNAQNAPPTLKDLKFWTAKEKKTRTIDHGEAMINSIQNGDQPLLVIRKIIQNQGDVNDALGYKKKVVVVTSDALALVAEKMKETKCKEKVEVQSEFEESDDEDISDLKNIKALLAKDFNRKKYYAKPTNNNLRTSSASSSANKKPE
nr:hypothetical protein [Tanacetum cinerariifolium]